MKKLVLLLFVGIVSFISCDEAEEIVDDVRTVKGIPASTEVSVDYLPLNAINFPVPITDIDVKGAIEEKAGIDDVTNRVEEVKLTSLKIKLVSADDTKNFDFLDEVTMFAKVEGNETKKIGWNKNVGDGLETITLETTSDYLDSYVKSNNLALTIQYKSNADVKSLTIELLMEFEAKVK